MYLNKKDLQTRYVGTVRKGVRYERITCPCRKALREEASRAEKNENPSLSDVGMVSSSAFCEGLNCSRVWPETSDRVFQKG